MDFQTCLGEVMILGVLDLIRVAFLRRLAGSDVMPDVRRRFVSLPAGRILRGCSALLPITALVVTIVLSLVFRRTQSSLVVAALAVFDIVAAFGTWALWDAATKLQEMGDKADATSTSGLGGESSCRQPHFTERGSMRVGRLNCILEICRQYTH